MKISCAFLAAFTAQETAPGRIDNAEPGLFDILIAQKTGLQFMVKFSTFILTNILFIANVCYS